MIDLDAVEANARALRAEADRHGLKLFAMTKQMGRNGSFCAALRRGGIDKAVAVDMECARACRRAGLEIGHIGHLVQVPRAEADAAASLVAGLLDGLQLREGGGGRCGGDDSGAAGRICWPASRPRATASIAATRAASKPPTCFAVADRLDDLAGGTLRRHHHVSGAPLRCGGARDQADAEPDDARKGPPKRWPARAGSGIEINAPGTTSSVAMQALADAGATQVEPGHGLTGTTPLHALEDLPELPAVVYVTEVSHLHHGEAYCFGGGLYIDPVFPDYQVKAVVAREPTSAERALRNVEIPPPAAIDYYGMIDTSSGADPIACRRHGRVRLPAAGFRHPRLHGRSFGARRRRPGRGARSMTRSAGRSSGRFEQRARR